MTTSQLINSELVKRGEEHLWHSMYRYNPEASPMVVVEAEGAWITDIEGDRYLDAMAGLWCVNVGYGREELAQAAYEQLKRLPYYPLTQSHLPAIQLGEKLNKLLDEEYVFFYSNSGSEANEVAFKIARQFHQQNGEPERYKFIARYRAYHGSSMGALSATGQAMRKYKYEPLVPGFLHVPPPDCYRCPYAKTPDSCGLACAHAIEQTIIWEHEETIAGIIMEPIITGGGVITPPAGYMQEVEAICRRHGILFIVDEVICGFGRTGKAFGFQHEGIKPDLITMAKGITSAYLPLAVTAVRKEIYEKFKGTGEYDHLRHINTFGGNPAACALAIKNLEIFAKEALFERSALLGERLLKELSILMEHPNVGDIRGKGLLVGIELVADKETKTPAPAELVNQVIATCKKKGLIIGKNGETVGGYNNILALSPPLSLTDEELTYVIDTVIDVIQSIGGGLQ